MVSRIVQSEKPVFVEALLAELAMEALDVAVLHRPTRGDEVQSDLVFVSPLIQRLGSEFSAVINNDSHRQTRVRSEVPPAPAPHVAPAARCPLR